MESLTDRTPDSIQGNGFTVSACKIRDFGPIQIFWSIRVWISAPTEEYVTGKPVAAARKHVGPAKQATFKISHRSGHISASLGITEPAIFGVNFRFMKPFIAGVIGGAVGALFGSLTGLGATTYGVTGIPGLLAINNIPVYVIELLIAAGIAFAVTMAIWKEEQPETAPAAAAPAPEAPAIEVPAASVIRCAAGTVLQPVKGNVIAREAIPDDTFASGVLGDGVGIEPSDELVVAPFDGTISSVAESQHAVGIESNGMEMLIHVGVDTVNMKGDGFTCLVKEGDEVKAGQPLIRFDRAKIKAAGYSDTVAVLLTNSDDLEGVECGLQ